MAHFDFITFCELYYSSTYIPLTIYNKDGVPIHSFPTIINDLCINNSVLPEFLTSATYPAIHSMASMASYGCIHINDSSGLLLVGPIFSTPINEEIKRKFMHENAIAFNSKSQISEYLSSILPVTYNQLVNILAYLHFCFNGEQIDVTTHFNITDTDYGKDIALKQTEYSYQTKEAGQLHATYEFEQKMLQLVASGDTTGLKGFLNNSISTRSLSEGIVADTPLRQAKNIFIGLVIIIGKISAINGGLDVEQTYQLMDLYSQECEHLQSVESVKALQYNMLLDFTERVSKNKIPAGISPMVFACIQYINCHTNEAISITDVAKHVGKCRSYVADQFKKELGFNIGAFIMHSKLEEAKSLLTFTDKEIGEISNYLYFSSQSYFHNVFKKKYGLTPKQYRTQTCFQTNTGQIRQVR